MFEKICTTYLGPSPDGKLRKKTRKIMAKTSFKKVYVYRTGPSRIKSYKMASVKSAGGSL